MKFRLVLCFAVLMVCLPIYGCNMPGPQARVGQIGGAQTWMDAPLEGSIIPFVPYEIVLHAYDPASVTQVELYANGNLLTTLPNPNPGQLLTTLKYLWSPAAPGNYTLSARAQSSGGVWGSEAIVMVTIVGSTATPVITVTDVITVTTTTTMTSTPTNTPTTVPAELSFTPRISTNQFYYGSCTPDQVTIQVFVSGGDFSSVVLFKQLKDQASGEATGWDEGTSMNPAGDGWFTRTITARSVGGADKVSSAWLLYQFVATDSSGQAAGRSQVYSDVTLSACSAPVRPTIITITPTTGRIIIHPPTPTLIPLPR